MNDKELKDAKDFFLEPSISDFTRIDGYFIQYNAPNYPRAGPMFIRKIFGRVLTQSHKFKTRTRTYRVYYPGYLHHIPYIKEGHSRIFIPKLDDMDTFIEILQDAAPFVKITPVEQYAVLPKDYKTGFQRLYNTARKKKIVQFIDWTRGLMPELIEQHRPGGLKK